MKINEALDIINDTKTVRAKLEGSNLIFATKLNLGDNHWGLWFLAMNKDAHCWHSVEFEYAYLSGASSQDLARTMDVVQRLLDTPIKERFPEKKYRLVANPNSLEQAGTYATKYVACIENSMDSFSFIYGGPTIFSEKDLKQIEESHPNIAPAIEAMKEEIKNDAC